MFASLSHIISIKKQCKLTHNILQCREDWRDWEAFEDKQLDPYFEQETIGKPQDKWYGANLLIFIMGLSS